MTDVGPHGAALKVLKELHEKAGNPKPRVIADRSEELGESVSSSTVYNLLNGKKVRDKFIRI
jgi:Fe2+ or Zn2+ uptake regulation protein